MKRVAVNIYNFIRMSHEEPSRFIQDDFDTLKNQILTVKQYGFPGTYALKYDALMEPRYQALLKTYLDEGDEISAWWEITEPLCRRAGVPFRGGKQSEEYDDRVDSAYSIGYAPEERKKLVDAYMEDFYRIFGKYPQSIGSWVLDSVTMAYAREHYDVTAAAICRDQMGVDGFTLWGGWPNGAYYPSRYNENIPAQTRENQLDIPVFRLLGPDPIYNFEADVRDGLQGVYTLEPSWLLGRDRKWIRWFFEHLTQEDTLGLAYAHVGQENNFLWENIRPGFAPQLDVLKELYDEGRLLVETMADTALRFRRECAITPPMTFQATRDWDSSRNLSAQWYASPNYRVGFLGENGHLRIRDFFIYDEAYPSRYLREPMKGISSNFDALPVLFPQVWMKGERPFIRLTDGEGKEPSGSISYRAVDDTTAEALLQHDGQNLALFRLEPDNIEIYTHFRLVFDTLPVFTEALENRLVMEHRGFSYEIQVDRGRICTASREGVCLAPEEGRITLCLGKQIPPEAFYTGECLPSCRRELTGKLEIPPFAPEMEPGDSVFAWGSEAALALSCREKATIRYTLDGSDPTAEAPVYTEPLKLTEDTLVIARAFLPDGRVSEPMRGCYRFALKDMTLSSATPLDARPVFSGQGLTDLLGTERGSLDYLDGHWRGTLEDMDVTCRLPEMRRIRSISMGFLSHHRSGIVCPQSVELYTGPSPENMSLREIIELPEGPGAREIEKRDVTFTVGETIGAFRLVARRYRRMPQWCAYRGTTTVFTMADSLIVVPETD